MIHAGSALPPSLIVRTLAYNARDLLARHAIIRTTAADGSCVVPDGDAVHMEQAHHPCHAPSAIIWYSHRPMLTRFYAYTLEHAILRSRVMLYAIPLVPAAVYGAHRFHAALFFIMGKYLNLAHRLNHILYVSRVIDAVMFILLSRPPYMTVLTLTQQASRSSAFSHSLSCSHRKTSLVGHFTKSTAHRLLLWIRKQRQAAAIAATSYACNAFLASIQTLLP